MLLGCICSLTSLSEPQSCSPQATISTLPQLCLNPPTRSIRWWLPVLSGSPSSLTARQTQASAPPSPRDRLRFATRSTSSCLGKANQCSVAVVMRIASSCWRCSYRVTRTKSRSYQRDDDEDIEGVKSSQQETQQVDIEQARQGG
jgi:hypothetical protein